MDEGSQSVVHPGQYVSPDGVSVFSIIIFRSITYYVFC